MDSNLIQIGETIVFKKPKGYTVIEFTRLSEEFMEDTIEYIKYDSRKPKPKQGPWIMLENLPDWIEIYEKDGFVRVL
jgi:hypothetical protein